MCKPHTAVGSGVGPGGAGGAVCTAGCCAHPPPTALCGTRISFPGQWLWRQRRPGCACVAVTCGGSAVLPAQPHSLRSRGHFGDVGAHGCLQQHPAGWGGAARLRKLLSTSQGFSPRTAHVPRGHGAVPGQGLTPHSPSPNRLSGLPWPCQGKCTSCSQGQLPAAGRGHNHRLPSCLCLENNFHERSQE